MKLNREEIRLLSEAMVSLILSESKAERNNKVQRLMSLDKKLYKFFLSQLTEKDLKSERFLND